MAGDGSNLKEEEIEVLRAENARLRSVGVQVIAEGVVHMPGDVVGYTACGYPLPKVKGRVRRCRASGCDLAWRRALSKASDDSGPRATAKKDEGEA